MRSLMASLVMVFALGLAAPASAQTKADTKQTDNRNLSVTIDLASVGGGVLALVTASGLVGIYQAGSMAVQGASLTEAVEVGAGLPVPVAVRLP